MGFPMLVRRHLYIKSGPRMLWHGWAITYPCTNHYTGHLRTKQQHIWIMQWFKQLSSQWPHNEHNGVPNHQPHDCLLNRLFWCRSKKTSKLRFTGLCEGNSPVTGEFPTQRASTVENVSIWWHHHVDRISIIFITSYPASESDLQLYWDNWHVRHNDNISR